jgi:hypothetical protein
MDGLAFCVASWPVLVAVVFFSKIFYGISRKAFGLVGKVLKARGSAVHVKQRWVHFEFPRPAALIQQLSAIHAICCFITAD